jgi:hypothetical protein
LDILSPCLSHKEDGNVATYNCIIVDVALVAGDNMAHGASFADIAKEQHE